MTCQRGDFAANDAGAEDEVTAQSLHSSFHRDRNLRASGDPLAYF